jgi:uncharacterized membrane protein (DUF373 family)
VLPLEVQCVGVCREVMIVCCEKHTFHVSTLCGQSVEILALNLVVHIVTSMP